MWRHRCPYSPGLQSENFLGFPVGIQVPVGYYDRDKAAWVPSPDGRIIKILGISGDLAELDTNGDGQADDGAGLGVTEAERRQLAGLYPAGQTLERIPLTHFSTYDPNYGASPVEDAEEPKEKKPEDKDKDKPDDPCKQKGSIIECENQVLGETVGIVGTAHSLNYRSDRVPGRRTAQTLDIALAGATLPAPLLSIELEIRVAGQVLKKSFQPEADLHYTFTWDGKDAYGRELMGTQPVSVRIGYAYPGYYNLPPAVAASFGLNSGKPVPGNVPTRTPVMLWQEHTATVGQWDARSQGLGGWTLDVHHTYDPNGKVLYLGTGERRSAESLRVNTINIVAGTGAQGFGGDGGPATAARLYYPSLLRVGPDGTVYITDEYNHRIRKVGKDGIITTVAGNGTAGFAGDGGPATVARLNYPGGTDIASDGSLYIADWQNNRIRKVDPAGIITTVAGTGQAGSPGDGGPAVQAVVNQPWGVAAGPDGSLFIAEYGGHRVRKIAPDGIITTVAGTGTSGFSGDGGPAAEARVSSPAHVAVTADGTLYIADYGNALIRKVGADGIITTVAGNRSAQNGNDGIPATQSRLNSPASFALGKDGSLYIADWSAQKIRRVGPDGIITTLAGTGSSTFNGDGGPAAQTNLYNPWGVDTAPDGSVYVTDYFAHRIRRIAPALPGFNAGDQGVASEDGSEVYQFNANGRHLRTVNALTGATIYSFAYDEHGRLAKVTDGDGLATTVERDATGVPVAIVGPFGQRTVLAEDANGYFSRITNPAGEAVRIANSADGLLLNFIDPKGQISTATYDELGRLAKDEDAAGGSQTLARTEIGAGYEASRATALNRVTTYKVEPLATGGLRRLETAPDGTTTETVAGTDGSTRITRADGTVTRMLATGDPRYSMEASIPKTATVATGGKTLTSATERTVSLADPANPLSLATLTEKVTINGRVSTSVYDAATRTTTRTSAAGRTTLRATDALGRVVRTETTGFLPILSAYDASGRLASVTQGSGDEARHMSFAYNPQGYLASRTDALGRVFGYGYDAAGRTLEETLPDGRKLHYSYDANGNLATLTPPGRPAHGLDYTAVNLPRQYTPPAVAGSGPVLTSYDLDQRPTQKTQPDGTVLSYAYDGGGRLAKLSVGPEDYTYGYQAATGKLTSLTAPDGGLLEFTHAGALLTQTQWTGAVAGRVNWAYDNDFRVTEIQVNGADPIGFQYDPDSLLTKAGDLTLARRADNGLPAATALGKVSDILAYNGFGELAGYTVKVDDNAVFTLEYVRDRVGRVTRKTETLAGTPHVFDYAYDLAGRLTGVKQDGAGIAAYTYDDNGNRLTGPGAATPASYDDQDRLLSYGGAAYTYDANGALKTRTVGNAVTQYRYDGLGLLREATLPDGTAIAYVLDGQGRRIGKRVGGTPVQGFLYQDLLRPVAELDGANTVVNRFVYAGQSNVPAYLIRGGRTYRIVTDHLGSVRLVIDTTDGSIVQRLDYDEFGRILPGSFTNPGFQQPFGYAGGLYDPDTGLVRFGLRDYDPETGRWTAKDPIGLEGGENLYAYAEGNPVNLIDPKGLIPQALVDEVRDTSPTSYKGRCYDPKCVDKFLRAYYGDTVAGAAGYFSLSDWGYYKSSGEAIAVKGGLIKGSQKLGAKLVSSGRLGLGSALELMGGAAEFTVASTGMVLAGTAATAFATTAQEFAKNVCSDARSAAEWGVGP